MSTFPEPSKLVEPVTAPIKLIVTFCDIFLACPTVTLSRLFCPVPPF